MARTKKQVKTNYLQVIRTIWQFLSQEKVPLALAVIGQAYSIGLWQLHTASQVSYSILILNTVVAIITAWALDLIIISTAFHKKTFWLHWVLALATSIVILVFSVAIAVEVYNDWRHSAFAVIVFLYSWFLAVVKADFALQSEGINWNKEEIISRILDVLGDDTPDYKIAKVVGGKTKTTLDIIKEIRENRKV